MRQLADEGMAMIWLTHEMGFTCDVSDREEVFLKGEIEEMDAPEAIFGLPKTGRQSRQ